MNNKKISTFANTLREKLREEVILKSLKLGISESKISDAVINGDNLVIDGNVFNKDIKEQREQFVKQVNMLGYASVIDEITYTWFNRFVALKFMSEKSYIPIKVFSSSVEGRTEPDLLTNFLDIKFMNLDTKKVLELRTAGDDEELYKFLILSLCNHLNTIMPFLFEKIQDHTELMFPEKLLRTDSILVDINTIIPEEDWKEVEVIGWLYQDYINPRKDKVFSDLKKNVKISKENIPAATQLFTPKWIVKYLVENSVGRLWLESNPNNELQSKLKYFIDQEFEVPKEKVISPEEITVLDPAMGSGHMLVYAFEVLYEIYKSQGYTQSEIAQTILNNNLYGLEIDNRATQLAGFAVVMKAREYDKDLFSKEIDLNLVAIQETSLECPIDEKKYPELSHLWKFFYDAKNYGSILNVEGYDFEKIDEEYKSYLESGTLSASVDKELIAAIIKQAKIMSAKYDVVVTNPPYMGGRNMNSELTAYAKKYYPNSKNDLFSMFIEKSIEFTKLHKICSMITMQSWMFLQSFEKMRLDLLNQNLIFNMAHFGPGVFENLGAFNVLTTGFIIKKSSKGHSLFIKLNETRTLKDKENDLQNKSKYILMDQKIFIKIPGTPLVYWLSNKIINIIINNLKIGEFAPPRQGLSTADNKHFVRDWSEVSRLNITFKLEDDENLKTKWVPFHKGGDFRRWYGNNLEIINWQNKGEELKNYKNAALRNSEFYFKKGITYSLFGFENFGVRYKENGFLFDSSAASIFPKSERTNYILSFLSSKTCFKILSAIAPTVNFTVSSIASLPIIFPSDDSVKQKIDQLTQKNIDISKEEWDSRETSWDFKINELIKHKDESNKLDIAFRNYCEYWKEKFFRLHKNEEELNQLFLDIYDLNDELDNKIPLDEITILKDEVKERKEDNLVFKKDVIIKQFLSYIVGCMFGRYNPEKEGFILANQGETIDDFKLDSKFKPDEDNIIPITDRDYFSDDIVGNVKTFLKTYFGENNITENLDFIASGLKGSGSPEEKLRRYFLKDFFKDHKKIYKKKPIYWLFTSGKEQGFNALIYMHRYNKEVLAKIRTDYLLKLQDKILTRIGLTKEDSRDKDILKRQSMEIKQYDELLNHEAIKYVDIDLDDGVTVNHAKFKGLLEDI
jgi:type II restriction/modification system DNA methylase subunit YeeA